MLQTRLDSNLSFKFLILSRYHLHFMYILKKSWKIEKPGNDKEKERDGKGNNNSQGKEEDEGKEEMQSLILRSYYNDLLGEEFVLRWHSRFY